MNIRALGTIVGLAAIWPSVVKAQNSSEPGERPASHRNGSTQIGVGVVAVLAAPAISIAGSGSSSFGIGDGAGVSLVVDLSHYRIEAVGTFIASENGGFNLGAGARAFFVLHRGDRSDFSLGAGAEILNWSSAGGRDVTRFQIEGGAQIRWFMTTNLALTAAGGLGINFGRGGWVLGFGGQPMGTFGLTYFF